MTNFFKKYKIASRALNYLKNTGLIDKVLDYIPVPGVKVVGNYGVEKL